MCSKPGTLFEGDHCGVESDVLTVPLSNLNWSPCLDPLNFSTLKSVIVPAYIAFILGRTEDVVGREEQRLLLVGRMLRSAAISCMEEAKKGRAICRHNPCFACGLRGRNLWPAVLVASGAVKADQLFPGTAKDLCHQLSFGQQMPFSTTRSHLHEWQARITASLGHNRDSHSDKKRSQPRATLSECW